MSDFRAGFFTHLYARISYENEKALIVCFRVFLIIVPYFAKQSGKSALAAVTALECELFILRVLASYFRLGSSVF